MKTKILTIIAITLLTIGCNDDVEYDYGDFREIYATYEGNNILTYNAQDDSPTVTLHADVWNEKTVAATVNITCTSMAIRNCSATRCAKVRLTTLQVIVLRLST